MNININLEWWVPVLVYSIFCGGMYWLYEKEIMGIMVRIRLRRRLLNKRTEKEQSVVERHLGAVLGGTIKWKISAKIFIWVLTMIFLIIFIVSIKTLPIGKGILVAGTMTTMPYIVLRLRLESVRRRSSHEGENLISNFLNLYRISGFNIYETIEKMEDESKNTKVSNGLLMKLLLELRSTGNPIEIKRITDKFAHILNTSWGRMLGYNIRLAAEKGMNVSLPLEDILIQLREARGIQEERKRMNSEAGRILVYLIPILYISTIVVSVKFIGITAGQFLRNQLFTESGFTFFSLIIFMFVANLAIMEVVNNQKFDF